MALISSSIAMGKPIMFNKIPFPKNQYNPLAWIIGNPKIGSDVWIGPFCIIDGSHKLEIGDGCDIASGAHIYTHSTHLRCVTNRRLEKLQAGVKIGKHTFIGANSVVMGPANIGDHVIIGANSFVTGNVPDYSIVVGPGRVVGSTEDLVHGSYSHGLYNKNPIFSDDQNDPLQDPER